MHVLTTDFNVNDLSLSQELVQRVQSLLRTNEIHAYEQAELDEDGVRYGFCPAVALARWFQSNDTTRRIENSPYWFFYTVDDAFQRLTLICLACGNEIQQPASRPEIGPSCPNCGLSHARPSDATPDADEVRDYLTSAVEWHKGVFTSQSQFLRAIQTCYDNDFRADTLAHLPRDRFVGTLKQLDLSTAPDDFRELFEAAFAQFGSKGYLALLRNLIARNGHDPSDIGALYMTTGRLHRLHAGRYRRFAGGPTLGFGRYHAVCRDESGADGSTMTAEMLSYSTPETGVYPVFFDSSNMNLTPFVVGLLTGGELTQGSGRTWYKGTVGKGFDHTRPALLMLLMPNDEGLSGNILADAIVAKSVSACNIKVQNVTIEGVLDLRNPHSQAFLAVATSELLSRFRNEGHNGPWRQFPNFGVRGDTNHREFLEILPLLVDPLKGGGAFTDAVGNLLRICGYNGLIFPSARRDGIVVRGMGIDYDDGWNFVDYRDAHLEFHRDLIADLSDTLRRVPAIPRKVVAVQQDGRCHFASGFHLSGAEERDRMETLRRMTPGAEERKRTEKLRRKARRRKNEDGA